LFKFGPDARGNIPEESINILAEVGKWMQKNLPVFMGVGRLIW